MRYRTALITGASSGIGWALAHELGRRGTRVALGARRRERLEDLAAAIRSAGGQALAAPMDVADTESTVRAIEALDDELGGLELVIAAAGVGPADRSAPHTFWRTLAEPCHVNFCGAAATLTAVLPRMLDRGRGHLVGISSLSAFGALPGSAAYCAPKAGLSMLLDCLRLDVAHRGVAVTSVHLGFVDTDMVAHRRAPMPQLVSAERAARHVTERLESRPARIDFPRGLALASRAGARIPRGLRDPLLRLLVR